MFNNWFSDVKTTQEEFDKIKIRKEEQVASYYHIREQLTDLTAKFTNFLVTPKNILPFLQPGRLVRAKEFDWGMIVGFRRFSDDRRRRPNPMQKPPEEKIVIDVLVHLVSLNLNLTITFKYFFF